MPVGWREEAVPQDTRDANITTLFKNKVDRSDCYNYRGISLLSIVGKLFARVVLNRLSRIPVWLQSKQINH